MRNGFEGVNPVVEHRACLNGEKLGFRKLTRKQQFS